MNRDPGPADCCNGTCNQGRNCPARSTRINTCDGGQQVDTEENLFDWVDGLVLATLYFMSLLAVVGAVVWIFYYFS